MSKPRSIWPRALDVLGFVLATAYALPTLLYPFSRDHALFSYIGRVWLEGGLPYRDVYDFKPPGIFALNAFATAIFGRNEWGIRVLEIASAMLLAWVVARAVRRSRPRSPGELGAIALLFVGLYYTTMNYWDTAQTEMWEALALLASYAVAARGVDIRRAAIVSGALVGVAVLFKFPAPLVGIVCTAVVATRAARAESTTRARVRAGGYAVLLHGVGAAAVVLLVGAYFAVRGGWTAMIDMLFRHLWDFHIHTVASPEEARESRHLFWVVLFGRWALIIAGAWLLAVVVAAKRKDYGVVGGALMAALLFVLSVGTTVLQHRYVNYQWGVAIPFACLCGAYAVSELGRLPTGVPLAAVLAAVAFDFREAPGLATPYRDMWKSTIAYVRGDIDRWTYLEPFRGPAWYSYRVEERLGDAIRDRARAGDKLEVRGYEPAVYIVAGLESPSRFAVEVPLFFPGLTFKRAEWQAEHDHAIWSAPPRFFVTFSNADVELALLASRGYVELLRVENMVALERVSTE